ncbi:MAG: PAS domain-containing protein [Firmicutes bacterium]|nr:PAS domain-containing protein [Bacillota bacterium]
MKREELVLLSHQRCRQMLETGKSSPAPPTSELKDQAELDFQITARSVLRKLDHSLLPEDSILAVSDPRGCIRFVSSEPSDPPLSDLLKKGAWWSEERIGTNGLALALKTHETVTVFGEEHLLPELKNYYTTGIPFVIDGRLLGGMLLVGRLSTYAAEVNASFSKVWEKINRRLASSQGSRNRAQSMPLEENMRLIAASNEEDSELGILLVDTDNKIIEMNAKAQTLLKKKPGEILSAQASSLEDSILKLCAKCLKANEPCFVELPPSLTGLSTPVIINVQPLCNPSVDSVIGTMLVVYDLGQTIFHQTAATFQALTHLDDDVVVLDKHGRIVFGNRFDPEHTGQHYLDVVFNGQKYQPNGEHNSLLIQALETGQDEINKVYQTPSGLIRQTHIRLLRDLDGSVVGVVGIRKDITEKHELKNQLVHFERLSTIGELATQTIHELRNPLAAMRASAQLALVLDDEEKDATLRQIIKEIDKINEFVSNILLLAKPTSATFRPENLGDILDTVLKLVKAKSVFNNVTVIKNYQKEKLSPVKANAKLLEQALLNVINNAFDAMKEGGQLTLEIIDHPKDNLQELIIKDTGPGITPEQLERLFTPFYTTKGDNGTGLGLAITKRIITENHGGRIWIESEIGRGTQVHIELATVDRSM